MTLRCLLFGHRWHNDHEDLYIHSDEPCLRPSCVIVRNPAPYQPASIADLCGIAARLERAAIADQLHARRLDHKGHADTFYAGMRYAEQLIRGEIGPHTHTDK